MSTVIPSYLISMGLIGAILFLLYLLVRERKLIATLRQSGVEADAEITKAFQYGSQYKVAYMFVVDGKRRGRIQTVSKADCELLAQNPKAVVTYLPNDPATSRLLDHIWKGNELILIYAIALFTIALLLGIL